MANGRGWLPGRIESNPADDAQPRAALRTFPAFRQEVQTWIRFGLLSTSARTRWRFGFQVRLVARIELLRLLPVLVPLLQT
jgi:hypothetical protein